MKFNLSVLQQLLVAVVLVGFSTSSPAVTVAVAVAGTREDSIGSVRGGVAAIADKDGDNQRRTKGAKTSPSGVLVSGTDGTDGPTNTRLEAEIVLEKKKMTTTTSTRKFIQRSVIGIKRITCSSFSWNEKKCNQKGDGACKFKESKNKCKTTCGKITGKDPTQCENVKGCKLNSKGKCKKKKKKEPSAPTSAPPTSEPPTLAPPTLAPTSPLVDIPNTLSKFEGFGILVTALNDTDIVDTLSGPGPFTVFAPLDFAFDALADGLLVCLVEEQNQPTLKDILLYHAALGKDVSSDLANDQLIPTLQGDPVKVDLSNNGVVKINEVTVTKADVLASNGVIHVIDQVLIPPELKLTTSVEVCLACTPNNTLLELYEYVQNVPVMYGGLYAVVDPSPNVELFIQYYYEPGRDVCDVKENYKYLCLQKCQEIQDCTVVQWTSYDKKVLEADYLLKCIFMNGGIETAPLFKKSPTSTLPFTPGISTLVYTLKSAENEFEEFKPSILVPAVPGKSPGSEDWTNFVYPGVGCVGTKGETDPSFDLSLVAACQQCFTDQFSLIGPLSRNIGCSKLAERICTEGDVFGGPDSFCSTVCFDCDDKVRTSILATVGQVFQEDTTEPGSYQYGCPMRDIYDPQTGNDLIYTCPPPTPNACVTGEWNEQANTELLVPFSLTTTGIVDVEVCKDTCCTVANGGECASFSYNAGENYCIFYTAADTVNNFPGDSVGFTYYTKN